MFADGVMFDGSSIAGWKAINESDMVLMPDPATVHMDPFFAQSTMVVLCDILDPVSGEATTATRAASPSAAEAYMKASASATRLCRPGSRILRVRRRQVQGRPVQHRLQA
jgi:glutamine synthetase